MIFALLLMAGAPSDPGWNCDEPQVQQEMNWCAGQEYKRADEALNAQWSETAAVLKRRDAERDAAHDQGAGFFETLLKAQRAWIAYRDAHCMSEGFAFRGGSMEPLIVATCKASLTDMRTGQLKDLIEEGG